jgi:uncharacterized UPF0160 family protein
MLSIITNSLVRIGLYPRVKVAVHDGPFHPDDIFAVAILSLYLKKPLKIFRTRDPKIWSICDYVFDVGGEYNLEKNIFDHHQAGYDEKRENGILYSSAGLAWKHFGQEISGQKDVFDRVDQKIIQGIDAEDNGIELYEYNFKGIVEYTFGDYLFSYNPTYYEKKKNSVKLFERAVEEAKKVLIREIKRIKDRLSTEGIVRDIYNKTLDKRIIILDDEYSWEKVISEHPEPIFVIRPVIGLNRWTVKCVPLDGIRFKNRLDLPEGWAGKRDEELQEITGVKDATFCHRGRFIAGAKSKEGAIKLAKLALDNL